ncbi:MAG: hypothetical protein GX620_02580 [Chloroflexi bacterium]|nr:hypothetical protein [Chloroflexota bacterium]
MVSPRVPTDEEIERLKAVKASYEVALMQKANVVGVGIGLRQKAGKLTGEPAIVVSVTDKVPIERLDPSDVIPSQLDGFPVDIQVVGRLRAL